MTPLVNKNSLQGNFFIEDSEPPNWLDGDLWSDTSTTPPVLFLNDNGTAINAGGTLVEDVTGNDSSTETVDTITDVITGDKSFSQTYATRAAVTVTVDEDDSIVVLYGINTFYASALNKIGFSKILDGITEVVAEVSRGITDQFCLGVEAFGVLTGVDSGSHTYNLQSKGNATDNFFEIVESHLFVAVIKRG